MRSASARSMPRIVPADPRTGMLAEHVPLSVWLRAPGAADEWNVASRVDVRYRPWLWADRRRLLCVFIVRHESAGPAPGSPRYSRHAIHQCRRGRAHVHDGALRNRSGVSRSGCLHLVRGATAGRWLSDVMSLSIRRREVWPQSIGFPKKADATAYGRLNRLITGARSANSSPCRRPGGTFRLRTRWARSILSSRARSPLKSSSVFVNWWLDNTFWPS